jgi:c-opsin
VNWELQIGSNRSYIFYIFTFGLIVPTVVIFVCYSNILREVRKVKTEINRGSSLKTSRRLHQKQLSFQSEAAEKRSTVMVAVMIAALLIAWTPYSILALIETFTGGNDGNSSPVSWPRRRLFSIPSFMAFLILRYTVRISTVKSIN